MRRHARWTLFTALAVAALGVGGPRPVAAQAPSAPLTWKLQTTWAAADILHAHARSYAEKVAEMSGGRLRMEVLPAGALVPAFEVLDAVHRGVLDMGFGSAAFWGGKHPAFPLFTGAPAGPFGMDWVDFVGWVYQGGGLELYNELLQQVVKLDVVALFMTPHFPDPTGWFPKPLRSWEDFKGLKFRTAGYAADLFKEAGALVVILPGGDIIPALERGTIDAAEFHTPTSDFLLGFHQVRKFLHAPGLHNATGMFDLLIHRRRWEALPADLKAILRYAALAETVTSTYRTLARNQEDLDTMVAKHGVTVVPTPKDILQKELEAWEKVAERKAKENAFFAKVYASQREWARKVVPFRRNFHPSYEFVADHYWKK